MILEIKDGGLLVLGCRGCRWQPLAGRTLARKHQEPMAVAGGGGGYGLERKGREKLVV